MSDQQQRKKESPHDRRFMCTVVRNESMWTSSAAINVKNLFLIQTDYYFASGSWIFDFLFFLSASPPLAVKKLGGAVIRNSADPAGDVISGLSAFGEVLWRLCLSVIRTQLQCRLRFDCLGSRTLCLQCPCISLTCWVAARRGEMMPADR